MSRNLTKREMKYLRPAINFGWRIHIQFDGTGCWNNDALFPVSIGPVCKKLIKDGFLVRSRYHIDVTGQALAHKCKGCYGGKVYDEDGDEYGDHDTCGGAGILLDAPEDNQT